MLAASMLVEKMEWDEDTAVGETAFWLKVLSTPVDREYKLQKIKFKRQVFSAWSKRVHKENTSSSTVVSCHILYDQGILRPIEGEQLQYRQNESNLI